MNLKVNPSLTPDKKRKILAILNEMQSRGIPIPKMEKSNVVDDWGTDENGYFIRNDSQHYEPAPIHKKFIESRARFAAYFSKRGGGKTGAGSQKALLKIKQGLSGAVINPDLENFRLSTWPELKRWIPWDMVVPRQRYRQNPDWDVTRPFSIVFMNGAIMYCKGLKDPDSARGPNLNWLWYDEAGRDKTGIGFRLAIAGVRVGFEPQAWATYTPKAFDHWTYKFFIEQEFTDDMLKLLEKFATQSDRPLIEWFKGEKDDNLTHLDEGFQMSMMMANPTGYLRKNEVEGEYANEEGALGDSSWFQGEHLLEAIPEWADKRIRFWDLAASEKKVGTDPDETVGSLLSCDKPKQRFCIENQVGGWWLWDTIKHNIVEQAKLDGPHVKVYIEQEPASGGKNQVAELKNALKEAVPGISVEGHDPKKDGDRVLAANVWFGEASVGLWYMVKGAWNPKFTSQLDTFPEGAHDDRITSVTGARHSIAPIRKWSKGPKFYHLNAKVDTKKEEKEKATKVSPIFISWREPPA